MWHLPDSVRRLGGGLPKSLAYLDELMKTRAVDLQGRRVPRARLMEAWEQKHAEWKKLRGEAPELQPAEVDSVLYRFAFGPEDSFQPSEPLCEGSQITWSQLSQWSVLEYGGSAKSFHLVLTKVLLQNAREASYTLSTWFNLYENLPSTDWDRRMQSFQIYMECLRHSVLADRKKTFRLPDYYRGQSFYRCGPEASDPAMNAAEDFEFHPVHVRPEQLCDKSRMHSFLSSKSYQCVLAPRDTSGWCSALWVSATRVSTSSGKESRNETPNDATEVNTSSGNETPKSEDNDFLFFFNNSSSEDPQSMKRVIQEIQSVIQDYNDTEPKKPLKEENVVIVFCSVNLVFPRKEFLQPSDWKGSLIVLRRKYLVQSFFGSLQSYFSHGFFAMEVCLDAL